MRTILYQRPDGGLSVVHPVVNTLGEAEGFTEAQAEQRAWNKLPFDAINPRFAEASEIPADRYFRNAWKAGASAVDIDMPKAREIHQERLRGLRQPKLEALDMEYLRADEDGDNAEKKRIADEKQVLRDVTDDVRIDEARTPEDLKAVIPDALK